MRYRFPGNCIVRLLFSNPGGSLTSPSSESRQLPKVSRIPGQFWTLQINDQRLRILRCLEPGWSSVDQVSEPCPFLRQQPLPPPECLGSAVPSDVHDSTRRQLHV